MRRPRQIKKGMEEALKAFTFALSNQMAAEANAAVAAGQTPVDAPVRAIAGQTRLAVMFKGVQVGRPAVARPRR